MNYSKLISHQILSKGKVKSMGLTMFALMDDITLGESLPFVRGNILKVVSVEVLINLLILLQPMLLLMHLPFLEQRMLTMSLTGKH